MVTGEARLVCDNDEEFSGFMTDLSRQMQQMNNEVLARKEASKNVIIQ